MWSQVDVFETLTIDCVDKDTIGDKPLGKFSFSVLDNLRDLPEDCTDATWKKDFALTDVRQYHSFFPTTTCHTLHLFVDWVPDSCINLQDAHKHACCVLGLNLSKIVNWGRV
jgi:hypothetical protein